MTSGAISKDKPVQVAAIDGNDVPAPTQAQPAGKRWIVQIGATPNQNGASQLIDDAASRITALADFRASVEPFEKNGQTFYRARFVGFGDRDDATQMCNQLKAAKMSCLAMQS
jgi:D-alanyl-D-alanine carboxypeptidase